MEVQKWHLFARILAATILIILTGFGPRAQAEENSNKPVIKVMTYNMDAGTDLGYLFTSPDLLTGATKTYGEILQSNIPQRAALLAKKIASRQPDLISLQEVTLWQTISADNQTSTLYDQLDLLLKALAARHQHYQVVASQNLTQNQLPVDPSQIGRLSDPVRVVRLTDRDVILARTDRKRSNLTLSNIQTHIYEHLLALPNLGTVSRGWLSVDAIIRGKQFRFANTHLEGINPFIPETAAIQTAQVEELLQAMNTTDLPVILAGDFNADAEMAGLGPDQTDTPLKILEAGYTDTWHARHPHHHGFTWPLYLEDPLAPNPNGPLERIDLIYERDLKILRIQRINAVASPFASDHAGVVAALRIKQK